MVGSLDKNSLMSVVSQFKGVGAAGGGRIWKFSMMSRTDFVDRAGECGVLHEDAGDPEPAWMLLVYLVEGEPTVSQCGGPHAGGVFDEHEGLCLLGP